ncbi:MAG: hypothetical protein KDK34_14770 [Leptospiraceae bacterium]|nr:hypothetical protein [Leptospiraceae bacterium]
MKHAKAPFPAAFSSAIVLILLIVHTAYMHVGHRAHTNFLIVYLATGIVACTAVLIFSGYRYLILAAGVPLITRLAGILFNGPAHSLAPALLAGVTTGMTLSILIGTLRSSSTASEVHETEPIRRGRIVYFTALLLATGVVLLQLLRASFIYYEPHNTTFTGFVDGIVVGDISANYAMYLALLAGINLLGPLAFLMIDLIWLRRHPVPHAHSGQIAPARQILLGLGLAAIVHLMLIGLQLCGWQRLFAGADDNWQEVGRVPGLLTDSGAATLLTPVLLFALAFALWWEFTHELPFSRRVNSFVRGSIVPVSLLIMIGLTPLFGRAYLINCAALLLVFPLFWWQARLWRQRSGPPTGWPLPKVSSRLRILLIGGAVLMGIAVFVAYAFAPFAPFPELRFNVEQVREHAGTPLNAFNIMAAIDPARAWHNVAALRMWLDHPLFGQGMNSFQVWMREFLPDHPEIAVDNPGSLYLGLLAHHGIIGSLVLLAPGILLLKRLATHPMAPLDLATLTLPIVLLPAGLAGYHLIFPEFVLVLLLPLTILTHPKSVE